MPAAATLTGDNVCQKFYHTFRVEENDADMVKIAAGAFTAAIETTNGSLAPTVPFGPTIIHPDTYPEAVDVEKSNSDMIQHHLDSLFSRACTGSESKKVINESAKRFPIVAVFACVIDLTKLRQDEEGATEKTTDGCCWPSVISDRWQFLCRCGTCSMPYHRFTLAVCTVVNRNTLTMPIKIFAFPHEHGSAHDALLKITLTSDHHATVSEGKYVSTYDRTHPLKIEPHQIALYQAPEEVRRLYDETDQWGNIKYRRGPKFGCKWGSQALVNRWVDWDDERQPMLDEDIFNHAYRPGSTPVPSKKAPKGTVPL